MRSLILTLTAFCLLNLSAVFAQASMVYGVIFDSSVAKKVSAVMPGSPADKAGILPGDIITAVNGATTNGLTNDVIRTALAKQVSASVAIARNGKIISMSKAPLYSFGRTCVSGNCETGAGRLRLANYGNHEYEGQFESGVPKGEFKIYYKNGNLLYKGQLKDFVADGSGKTYDRDDSGADVIIEEGDYNNGDLYNGIRYRKDGSLLTSGQYLPDGGLKSAYRMTTYCGKICNIFVENIRRGPDGPIYNGKVTIREQESDNPEARKLLEAYFTNGKPNGIATVWDYDNGVYHFMQYRNGVIREDGLNAGMIYRIADHVPLATEVKYADDASATNNWQNRIVSGLFHFGDKFLAINSPDGGSPLSTFKRLYNNGTGELFDPNGPPKPAPNYGGSEIEGPQGDAIMIGVEPGHSREEVEAAIQACIRMGTYNKTQIDKLAEIWNGITRSNYDRQRLRFEVLQGEIVNSYSDALYKYKGAIPSKLWFAIERKRNEIKAMQVPSYVQY